MAGAVEGVSGPVKEIAANPLYLELNMEVAAKFNLPIPEGHTAMVYVFYGQAIFGEQEVAAVELAVFDKGDQIEIRTGDLPVRLILMTGVPFDEPVFPYGPFVMNMQEEIQQALTDLRNGIFVHI